MVNSNKILNKNEEELTGREKTILRKIVHLYILKANPVGSRVLSKFLKDEIDLSPATIRNVMSDLEEMEYIRHPHTSAGRVPTDKGYRFYVDALEQIELLNIEQLANINLDFENTEIESILKDASKLLGMLSKYLGVVQIPLITELIVEKIEVVRVTSSRILVVIALDSNIVRTVTLEANFDLDDNRIKEVISYINEKISGKPLKYLRDNFKDMIVDLDIKDTPLVRLFTDSLDKLFADYKKERVLIAGTKNLFEYPEFEDLSKIRSVIELIENEDIIIHILDKYKPSNISDVLIGQEMQNDLLEDYSLVKSSYKMGTAKGSVGLIGPKRMDYAKMISVVRSVSNILTNKKK